MARKRREKILENVEVTGIADKGKAVGRHEGQVVFIEGAVPGDIVDIRVSKKRKGHYLGRVVKFHSKSPDRVDPVCSHFGVCGGCKWQHLSYEAQLKHKQITVENALSRIGGIDISGIRPILGSSETTYYRNKLEFSFSNKRWITEEEVASGVPIGLKNALGFHRPGAFDKIVDVEKCYLQPDPSNAIRNAVRDYAEEHELSFFDIRQQSGLLRQLYVRACTTGDVMVIVSFFYDDKAAISGLLDFLKTNFPELTSLMYVINDKKNDTIFDLEIQLWEGNPYLVEELGHVKFKIGPKSFFQTNSRQAKTLYDVIVDFAKLSGNELVYDLYTGIGSIACYVANNCKAVIGIEEIEAAIDDAKENAKLNGLSNTNFFAGDVRAILTGPFIEKHGRPDLVITDPPRAGMHKDVVEALIELKAPRIVYVSCNPATQARDLDLLKDLYKVEDIQPVDMFPHTHHIENVVSLALFR